MYSRYRNTVNIFVNIWKLRFYLDLGIDVDSSIRQIAEQIYRFFYWAIWVKRNIILSNRTIFVDTSVTVMLTK